MVMVIDLELLMIGRTVSGDKLLLLLAKEMLKSKKCKVIADVKCSQVLFDEVKRARVRYLCLKLVTVMLKII